MNDRALSAIHDALLDVQSFNATRFDDEPETYQALYELLRDADTEQFPEGDTGVIDPFVVDGKLCGACFTHMLPKIDTHPGDNGVVAHVCDNCGRVYTGEGIENAERLDTYKGEINYRHDEA